METAGWVKDVFDWVQQNPNWTGIIIFSFSFLESLLLVGIIFPGAAFLVSLGALIGLGVLDFYSAWFWASFGGFAGDGLSFWIGHHYRERLLTKWPINRFPNLIDNGRKFFNKYGGVSVFIGRFVGPVRPVIPAIVGMMAMPVKRYIMISVTASILWAPFYLLPGILFGSAIESMAKVAIKLSVLMLILASLIWVVYWFIQFIYQLWMPRAYHWLSRALAWSQRHPKLGRFTSALIDPRQPETGSLAMLAFIVLLFTLLMIVFMATSDVFFNWNQSSQGFFYTFHNPWTIAPMQWLFYLGHDVTLWTLTVLTALWLAYRRLKLALSHWLTLSISAYLFALLICRIDHGHWHFFAGHHVFWFVSLCSFWAVLVAGAYPIKWRSWPYIITAILAALYTFATLFFFKLTLQIAVLSGIMATIWSMIVGLGFRTRYRRQFLGLPLKLIFLLVMLLMPIVAWLSFPGSSQIDKPAWLANQSYHTTTGWANTGQQQLDLKFQIPLEQLEQRLHDSGWQTVPTKTWPNIIRALSVNKDGDLPLLPYIHQGELEHLLMQKQHGKELWALRVWPGPQLEPNLWLATVTRHARDTDLFWFNHWGYLGTLTDKTVFFAALQKAGFKINKRQGSWLITLNQAPQNETLNDAQNEIESPNRAAPLKPQIKL